MGALSHYIERAGVATTGISLIREHVAGMNVPRSLWVPFPLGRPMGPADDAEFQRDVLRAGLQLLNSATEPTVADYERDAPMGDPAGEWACAVALPQPEPTDDADALAQGLLDEVRALAPWYDEGRRSRGRSSVGASGLGADQIELMAGELARFAGGAEPQGNGEAGWAHPAPVRYKFMADDLRAFYHEAAAAQPGARPGSDADLNGWVFGQTQLGEVLRLAADRFQASGDQRVATLAIGLIPAGYRSRSLRTW